MLVRDALRELSVENHLALGLSGWITCKENRNGGRGKPGSRSQTRSPTLDAPIQHLLAARDGKPRPDGDQPNRQEPR